VTDEEEGTGHNCCSARNHRNSADVLWQYKKEYTKHLANKARASRVVNHMFEFDDGIYKMTDWQKNRSEERQGLR
jgi:hypothetical protein